MISIFNGERDITPPSDRNITTWRKREHDLYCAISPKKEQIERLRRDAADPHAGPRAVKFDPTMPQGEPKTIVRPTQKDVLKAEHELAELESEYASVCVLIAAYEREHPDQMPQERQRAMLNAQFDKKRRLYVDAQLDAAAGDVDPQKLIPLRDELVCCEQAIAAFDEAVQQDAERAARVAKELPKLTTELLDQLAAFDRLTSEQQKVADALRETYQKIDALKDKNGRVTGISGELLALALPFEALLRWNYDVSRPVKLFERWQRAFRTRNVQAA